MRRGYDLHARFQLAEEPEIVYVVFRDADDDGDVIVGTYPGECPGSVSRALHHKDVPVVPGPAGADAEGLGFLEGAGLHFRPDLRPVSGEGYVEVGQTQEGGQSLALVCDGGMGMFQGPLYGEPVGIFVQSPEGLPGLEQPVLVNGPHKRRGLAVGICKGPACVVHSMAVRDIHQAVLRGFESHGWFML